MAESTTPIAEASQTPSERTPGDLIGPLGRLRGRIAREFWHDDPSEPVLLRGMRSLAQLVALTIRGFQADQLLLRASALTYVTAISVIPMLGVIFAVLRLVGGTRPSSTSRSNNSPAWRPKCSQPFGAMWAI